MEITARYQHPLEHGVISAICPTTHWCIVGTTTGTLSIWDLRFGLIVKSWRVNGRITALRLHPARGKSLWLMVSTVRDNNETPLVSVYDVESSKLVEVYEVRATRPSSTSIEPEMEHQVIKTKAELIAGLAASDETPSMADSSEVETVPSVLAIMTGQAFASLAPPPPEAGLLSTPDRAAHPGWMVTAGEDRVVRYWDLVKSSESFIVCGSQKDRDVTFKQTTSDPGQFYTLPITHRQSSGSGADRHAGVVQQRQPLRPHYDAIAALGSVETPFSSCVISGDRSGIVKVWRMEGQAKE
jgi:phosphoinositide-3-kinase regulatory subunit 4